MEQHNPYQVFTQPDTQQANKVDYTEWTALALQSGAPQTVVDQYNQKLSQSNQQFNSYDEYYNGLIQFTETRKHQREQQTKAQSLFKEELRRESEDYLRAHPDIDKALQQRLYQEYGSNAVQAVELCDLLTLKQAVPKDKLEECADSLFLYLMRLTSLDEITPYYDECMDKWDTSQELNLFMEQYAAILKEQNLTLDDITANLPEVLRNELAPTNYHYFLGMLYHEQLSDFLVTNEVNYRNLKRNNAEFYEYIARFQVYVGYGAPQLFAEFFAGATHHDNPISKAVYGLGSVHGKLARIPMHVSNTYRDGIKNSMSTYEFEQYTANKDRIAAMREAVQQETEVYSNDMNSWRQARTQPQPQQTQQQTQYQQPHNTSRYQPYGVDNENSRTFKVDYQLGTKHKAVIVFNILMTLTAICMNKLAGLIVLGCLVAATMFLFPILDGKEKSNRKEQFTTIATLYIVAFVVMVFSVK